MTHTQRRYARNCFELQDGKLLTTERMKRVRDLNRSQSLTGLKCIFEEDFLGFSYGFRPGRGQHNALDALCVGITSKKVNYILDADIRSFLDCVSYYPLVSQVQSNSFI